MKSRLVKLFFAAVTGLMLNGAAFAQTTGEVWQHHIDAWEARDLDEIAADYAEDSLLIINNDVYRGRSEIRGVFSRLFQIFDAGSNQIDPAVVEGRIVFITWHFTPNKGAQDFYGTDTFVIEDGKITVQTIASPLYDIFPIRR